MNIKVIASLIMLYLMSGTQLSLAQMPSPAERLGRSLSETTLNSRARSLLEASMAEDGIQGTLIEDAVKLKVLSHQWVVYRGHWLEVQTYLQKLNLRIGLVPTEIEYYRNHGELPPPDLQSYVEALELSPAHTLALRENGANTIGDVLKLRRRRNGELFISGLGKLGAIEIAEAMAKLGFPLNREAESAPEVSVESWTAHGELTVRTLTALSRASINQPEHLLALTEFELEQIDGLGPQGIMEIGVFFKNRSIPLYDTVLDRAIGEWQALDLALNIHPAARVSSQLRHHLTFLGIENFADLLNQQKVGRMRTKPLPPKYSRELQGLVQKFHKALEPTLEIHAQMCGMALL